MTGASDTKPIWPDRMPNVNVNAKIIDHPDAMAIRIHYNLNSREELGEKLQQDGLNFIERLTNFKRSLI